MQKITTFFSNAKKRSFNFIDTHPFKAFLALLALLFGLILLGNYLRTPAPPAAAVEPEPKRVEIYTNGESPTVTLTAKIEKTGIFTIMAQTPGIVQKINFTEGMYIERGKTLISLSTNYHGGNAATVGRQIAQRSARFNNETYELQKTTIAQQREVAERQETQAAQLRDINRQSFEETRNLIKVNEDITKILDEQINELEETNVAGMNDSLILQAKQGRAGALTALSGLRAGLRSNEYASSEEEEGAQLDRLTKEITLKQLELQEKSLKLTKDLGNLNAKLARISELLMFPTTPCSGIVERVFVKPGQSVTPGTPLAQIRADARDISAIISVPSDLAPRISRVEPSTFIIRGGSFSVAPHYVSAEPTDGSLHTVLYSIPGEYEDYFPNGQQVSVSVPVGSAETMGIESTDHYIPLDAVYQTQDSAYVYVLTTDETGKKRARVKQVTLGEVSGHYVAVFTGLETTDVVIVTRGISDGDLVATE